MSVVMIFVLASTPSLERKTKKTANGCMKHKGLVSAGGLRGVFPLKLGNRKSGPGNNRSQSPV